MSFFCLGMASFLFYFISSSITIWWRKGLMISDRDHTGGCCKSRSQRMKQKKNQRRKSKTTIPFVFFYGTHTHNKKKLGKNKKKSVTQKGRSPHGFFCWCCELVVELGWPNIISHSVGNLLELCRKSSHLLSPPPRRWSLARLSINSMKSSRRELSMRRRANDQVVNVKRRFFCFYL